MGFRGLEPLERLEFSLGLFRTSGLRVLRRSASSPDERAQTPCKDAASSQLAAAPAKLARNLFLTTLNPKP